MAHHEGEKSEKAVKEAQAKGVKEGYDEKVTRCFVSCRCGWSQPGYLLSKGPHHQRQRETATAIFVDQEAANEERKFEGRLFAAGPCGLRFRLGYCG
jgi:hypothetical protein